MKKLITIFGSLFRSRLKNEITTSDQVAFQANAQSRKIVSTDGEAPPGQSVKPLESSSRNGSQSRKRIKAADNTIINGQNDINTIKESDYDSSKMPQGEE